MSSEPTARLTREAILKKRVAQKYVFKSVPYTERRDLIDGIIGAMTEYAHQAIEESAASALDSHMSNAPGNTIVEEILKLKEKY